MGGKLSKNCWNSIMKDWIGLGRTTSRRNLKRTPLGLKAEIAKRTLEACELCEFKCRVNRFESPPGYCRVRESLVTSNFLHLGGEEPELVLSYTTFFRLQLQVRLLPELGHKPVPGWSSAQPEGNGRGGDKLGVPSRR